MTQYKCNKDLYISFLISSSIRYSATALSEVSPKELAHDSVTRWLSNKTFTPRDLWDKVEKYVDKEKECTFVIDDTLVEKPRSKEIDLVKCGYSGNKHGLERGINVVTALCCQGDEALPVDFRIYAKEEDGKTKNTHFIEMLKSGLNRGLKIGVVVADSWYSSLKNLKSMRDLGLKWVVGLKKNRRVNIKQRLEDLEIPLEGLKVHLQGYGWIKAFKTVETNGHVRYFGTNILDANLETVLGYFKIRWSVEVYHREIKQTCGISRCQARSSRAQRNHILLAVLAWTEQWIRTNAGFSMYELKWSIIKTAISAYFKKIYALT